MFYWFTGVVMVALVAGAVIVLLARDYNVAIIVACGLLPAGLSLILIRKSSLEVAAAVLSIVMISLITAIATMDLGIHHIAILGYPAVLIVASLVIRDRTMVILTVYNVLCVAWLVFGEILGIYTPETLEQSVVGDFFSVTMILSATAALVRILSQTLFRSGMRLQAELKERQRVEKHRELLIRELEDKNAELINKNDELERFTYTVSHDLKSPLITISGFAKYAEEDAKSGDAQKLQSDVQRISEAAGKMNQLLDELLELSRVGRIIGSPEEVSFGDIAAEAVRLLEGQLSAGNIVVNIEPDLPSVHCDRPRLVEAVQNLVSNAAKFMGQRPGPRVRQQGVPAL